MTELPAAAPVDFQWTLQFGFNVIQFIFTAAVAFYVRRATRREKIEERFSAIEEDLASRPQGVTCSAQQARMTILETRAAELRIEMDHIPSQRQIDQLNRSITNLSGELKATQGRLEGINRAVDLMNQFLINQGGKQQ